MHLRIFLFLFCIAAADASAVRSPAVLRPPCRDCKIQVQRVATLGLRGGELGVFRSAARAADGRYYVVSVESAAQVQVFSPEGEFQGFLSRPGDGPGEARFIWNLAVHGDSLFVYHREKRISVFDLDGELGRTFAAPFALDAARLTPSMVVINSDIRSQKRAGLPLHVVEHDSLLQSFGSTTGFFRADVPWASWRHLAPASRESVWAIRPTEYALEEWSIHGELLRELRRNASWFEPHTRRPSFHSDTAPPPRVNDIQRDANGYLWILMGVADHNWQAGLELASEHPDGRQYVPSDLNKYFDTIIEVIEPAGSRVVASGRMDAYAQSFVGEHRVVSSHILENMTPVLHVWKLGILVP